MEVGYSGTKELSLRERLMILKAISILFLLVFSQTVHAGKKCDRIFIEKIQQKYTENFPIDLELDSLSVEPLGKFGNSLTFKATLSSGEDVIQKVYLDKEQKFYKELRHVTAEENLAGDLARFSFYEKIKQKYGLNFSIVRRLAVKENFLFTKYIDGLDPLHLKANFLDEELLQYNNLVKQILVSVLTETKSYGGRPVFMKAFREFSDFSLGEIKLANYLPPLEQINAISPEGDALRLAMIVEFPNGIRHPFILVPSNFIFDFDLDQFVMIDPI